MDLRMILNDEDSNHVFSRSYSEDKKPSEDIKALHARSGSDLKPSSAVATAASASMSVQESIDSPEDTESIQPFTPLAINTDNHLAQTILTTDASNDTSDDDYMTSSTFSDSGGYSSETDDDLMTGDEQTVTDGFHNIIDSSDESYKGDLDDSSLVSMDIDPKEESRIDQKVKFKDEQGDYEKGLSSPEDNEISRCEFMAVCHTGSRDYRKVTSHIFGRNKKCTTQIPESWWIVYCRKHYQRTRYRTTKAVSNSYFHVQIDIIQKQLNRFQKWGGVRSWTIALGKKARTKLREENEDLIALREEKGDVNEEDVRRIHRCKDRFLIRYCGAEKTFAEVHKCLRVIRTELERAGRYDFPCVEFLPDIDEDEFPPQVNNRRPRGVKHEEDSSADGEDLLAGFEFESEADEKKYLLSNSQQLLDQNAQVEVDSTEDEDEEDSTGTIPRRKHPTANLKRPHLSKARAYSSSTSLSSTPHRISKREPKHEKDKRTRRLAQVSQRQLTFKDDAEDADAELSAAVSSRGKVRSSESSTAPGNKDAAYHIMKYRSIQPAPSKTNTNRPPGPLAGFFSTTSPRREVAYLPSTPRTPPVPVSRSELVAREVPLPANPSRTNFNYRILKKMQHGDGKGVLRLW